MKLAENTPDWVNWLIIVGGAAVAWLAPLASFVAIVWGCIQIYDWYKSR